MTDDCKRHFRQKVRDIMVKLIRKFGTDIISGMVPTSDQTMHKRLKNIRKIETRKQKVKEQRKEMKDDESDEEFNVKRKPKSLEEILADSDEDFDGSDDEESVKKHTRKTKKKTWIQESENNIVDFIDPGAAKNISATKPINVKDAATKEKSKDRGFKTAPDGRLIIADNSDISDDEKTKKKKNKLEFMGSDSENDIDDDVKSIKSAKSSSFQRKRKLNDSTESLNSDAKSLSSKYQAGGSGIHRPLKSRKKEKDPGQEYRAKKAFGDVKRKGKPDPYAYVPLKRSALNRRKKMKSGGDFKNLLSHSKKDKKVQKNSRNRKK